MDRLTLFMLLATGEAALWRRPDGSCFNGHVEAIEREDGSGYLFNVRLTNETDDQEWLFVRCLRP
jgi:hypothetical protein